MSLRTKLCTVAFVALVAAPAAALPKLIPGAPDLQRYNQIIPVVAGDLLTPEQLEAGLKSLDGWKLREDGKAIVKSFVFSDFSEAFGFMARVALEAEKIDHHPTWTNVYKNVDITLNSFNKNGVTNLDIELAQRIDKIVKGK